MWKRPSIAMLTLAGTSLTQTIVLGIVLGFVSSNPLAYNILIVGGSLLLALPGLYFACTLSNRSENGQAASHPERVLAAPKEPEAESPTLSLVDQADLEGRLDDASKEAGQLRHTLQILDAAMRSLAAGDLSIRIDEHFGQEFEGLRNDFNRAVARLQEPLAAASGAASSMHGTVADIQAEAHSLQTAIAAQTGTISSLASETGRVLDAIKVREAAIEHIANIGHNAVLDMRRGAVRQDAPLIALRGLASVAEQMAPVADRIVELALRTNMAAMQLKIGADATERSISGLGAVADMGGLAEQAADAAKTIAQLARTAQQTAIESERQVERLVGELAATGVYLETLHQRIAALAEPETQRRNSLSSLRASVMSLAKSNRDHVAHLHVLLRKGTELTVDLAKFDREAGRLSLFSAEPPESVSAPPPGPKRPPHLRLIKS